MKAIFACWFSVVVCMYRCSSARYRGRQICAMAFCEESPCSSLEARSFICLRSALAVCNDLCAATMAALALSSIAAGGADEIARRRTIR